MNSKQMLKKETRLNNSGYSLLELVLVISIIGILIAIIMPNFKTFQDTAKISAHNSNVRMLKTAAALYYIDFPDEDGTIENDKLEPYLDNKDAIKVDKSISSTEEFTVNIDKGQITVSPGEVKRGEDNTIIEKASGKTIKQETNDE